MNVRRGGLGRGLGALIPTAPEDEEATGARLEELPLDSIEPNPRQPREVFDEEALAELVASIKAVGVLQPVVVREVAPDRYQLIMGERRWRASREAELRTIPAIVRETSDDALLRDALLENLHRQQLNPLEEGAAYQQLLEEFGTTHEELADRIGRSRSHVTNTLRLLNLAPAVQRRVAAGVLSAGHARALLGLDEAEAQDRLAARIVAEGLSVRAVEEIVSLGAEERPSRAPRQRSATPPELEAAGTRLADALDTRVRVDMGRRRGKIVIEFASRDDLDRIVGRIVTEVPASVQENSGVWGGSGGSGDSGDGSAGDEQQRADQRGPEQHAQDLAAQTAPGWPADPAGSDEDLYY